MGKIVEEYFVIKFDNDTYFDKSRYSQNKLSKAKFYPTEQEADQAKDKVIIIFPGVDKTELEVVKVIIMRKEL